MCRRSGRWFFRSHRASSASPSAPTPCDHCGREVGRATGPGCTGGATGTSHLVTGKLVARPERIHHHAEVSRGIDRLVRGVSDHHRRRAMRQHSVIDDTQGVCGIIRMMTRAPEHAEPAARAQHRRGLFGAHCRVQPVPRLRRYDRIEGAPGGVYVSNAATSVGMPRRSATSAIPAFSSTPKTRAPRSATSREAMPVPHPTSSTESECGDEPITSSIRAEGYVGRDRSYRLSTEQKSALSFDLLYCAAAYIRRRRA